MPAYFDTGFTVRTASWHGLETLLAEPPKTVEEARRLAGIEWEPVTKPIYNEMGAMIEGWQRIARDDNDFTLDVAPESYEIIKNQTIFEIIQAVCEAGAHFETAGSVRDGRQIYAMARLDEPLTVAGDSSLIYPYVAMLGSHDRSTAAKVLPTTVRVVCWNTYQAATREAERTGKMLTFKHTRNVKDRIEEAKTALASVHNFAWQWKDDMESLVSMKVDKEQTGWFVSKYLPLPKLHTEMTDRQVNNLIMNRETLSRLIEYSPTMEGIRDTAYGLVQAAGEYEDHYKRYRSNDNKLIASVLSVNPRKKEAIELALAAAKE